MIKKSDFNALQQKLAATEEALRNAKSRAVLAEQSAATATAERDSLKSQYDQARGEAGAVAATAERVAAAEITALKRQNSKLAAERLAANEELDEANARIENLEQNIAAMHETTMDLQGEAKAQLDLEKEKSAGLRLSLADMQRELKSEAARASKAATEANAARDAIKVLEADLVDEKEKRADLKAKLRQSQAEAQKAKKTLEKMSKVRPEVVKETKVKTVTVCEREPADIAEIERLKAELAACRSGQADA